MKIGELRQLSGTEWDQKLVMLKQELYDLRKRAKTGKLDKPSQIRFARRDIARLMTLKNESRRKGETSGQG